MAINVNEITANTERECTGTARATHEISEYDELKRECTGTARATHEMSEYDSLEREYGEEVAITVTTKAFQHSFPHLKRNDIASAVKVIAAARSGKVSVRAERQRMEDQAASVVGELLERIAEVEEVS